MVHGDVGTAEDVDVLTHALDVEEPLVRERAAWALAALRGPARRPTASGADAGRSHG